MLTIVIVNYKNDLLTARFIKEQLSLIKLEKNILIVNNSANIESTTYLSETLNAAVFNDGIFEKSSNGIYILPDNENLGFAKGNNKAVDFSFKYLSPSYFLFTNNDIVLKDSDVVERLLHVMSQKSDIGLIGPKVIGLKGECQSPYPYIDFLSKYCWMYLCTPFASKQWKIKAFNLDYAQNAKEGYHYRVMGSFFLMRAEDYKLCGGMDSNTFLFSEEQILSERLNTIGKRVYYYPSVTVIHAHGVTTKKELGLSGINKCKLESDIYYYQKYKNTPVWKILIGKYVYLIINFITNSFKK